MKLTNRDQDFEKYQEPAPLQFYYGSQVPDGDAAPWSAMPIGSVWVDSSTGSWYRKSANAGADADWRGLGTATSGAGYIGVPLANLREVASNNFLNAAGNGGILATDTTPIFQYTNGDTDSAARLNWASSNSDALHFQVGIPTDYDEASVMTINFLAAMGGATDTPTLSCDCYFNVGDTKVTVASGAVTGTTPATYTATLTAANVDASAKTLSVEITPGAHTTDTLLLYAVWIVYTRV